MRRIESELNENGRRIVTLHAETPADLGELYRSVLLDLDREVFHLSTIPVDNHEAITYYLNELKLRIQRALEGTDSFVENMLGDRINLGYERFEEVTDEDDDN